MKLWQGIAIGVIAYLLFLIVEAPAAKLWPHLRGAAPAVHLTGVSGSVWRGQAAQLVATPVRLEQVSWRLQMLPLLLGRAEFAVDAQLAGRPLKARVGDGLFGGPYLSGVAGALPVQTLLDWLSVRQLTATGMLNLALERVEWSDAPLPVIDGVVDWAPASVTRPAALSFGEARLEAEAGEEMSEGVLSSRNGVLVINADLTLATDGQYTMNARVQQKGDVAPEVSSFLSTFAEYRNGQYIFEWSDRIALR